MIQYLSKGYQLSIKVSCGSLRETTQTIKFLLTTAKVKQTFPH